VGVGCAVEGIFQVVEVKQISISLRYLCSPFSHASFTMATVRSAKCAFLKHFFIVSFQQKKIVATKDQISYIFDGHALQRFAHSKRKAQNNEPGHSTAKPSNQ